MMSEHLIKQYNYMLLAETRDLPFSMAEIYRRFGGICLVPLRREKNVSLKRNILPDYTMPRPTRQQSSQSTY